MSKNRVKKAARNRGIVQAIKKFAKKAMQAIRKGLQALVSGSAKLALANAVYNAAVLAKTVITSALKGIASVGAKIASVATHAFSVASAAVSSTLGISTVAANVVVATALSGVTLGGAGMTAMAVSSSKAADVAIRGDEYVDCAEGFEMTSIESDMSGDIITMGKDVYSICHYMGLPDVNIAGIISNLHAECSVDPTAVETIFTENYMLGEEKLEAVYGKTQARKGEPGRHPDYDAIDYFTRNVMRPRYSISLDWNFYCAQEIDGKHYAFPGIGLTSATGPLCYDFLKAADESNEGEWYTIEFGLAHLFSKKNSGDGRFKDGVAGWTEPAGSPSEAAADFFYGWEMPSGTASQCAQHAAHADEWLSEIESWHDEGFDGDDDLGESAKALMERLGASADVSAQGHAEQECRAIMSYDNSDIAHAAVSYAYATEAEGEGNDGTELFRQVHDEVYPGDGWYQSCDRGASCAIKWCGADVEFPAGSTTEQGTYLATSPKWKEVDTTYDKVLSSEKEYEKLQPGDVFCTVQNGHIFLFVGEDIITEMHGDAPVAGSNIVSASFQERSPGCGVLYSDERAYKIWRCVDPDNSSEYKDAGAGAAPAKTLKKGSVFKPGQNKKNFSEDDESSTSSKKSSSKNSSKTTSSKIIMPGTKNITIDGTDIQRGHIKNEENTSSKSTSSKKSDTSGKKVTGGNGGHYTR